MAIRRTGITDEFVIETSDGTDITSELGPYSTISWTLNKNTQKQGSIGQQPNFIDIIDGVVDIETSLTVDAPSLEVINTLTDGLADKHPSFTLKFPVTTEAGEEETLIIEGVKFDASLEVSDDELVSVDFNGIGLECSTDNTVLDTPMPDNTKALTFMDVYFEIENEEVEVADSFNIDFNRSLEGARGIKSVSSEEQKPFYDEIIEGMKDFSGSLDFQITDDMATKHFFDNTGDSKVFSGSQRSLISEIKMIDDRNNLEMVLTDCQFSEISSSQDLDTEVRVISSTFDCLDASISEVEE